MAERKLEVKQMGLGDLLKSGGGSQFLKNLKGKGDEKTLEKEMRTLSNLARDRRAAKKISRNKDTISTLLKALNDSPKFTRMVEYAVSCIKSLAVDVVSCIELVDEGVVEALRNVLALNPYNERIQELVNQALGALCMTPDLAALVGEKLGTKDLLRSMNKHVEIDTLVSSCEAMHKLFKYEKNVENFVKDGAIPALATVIKTSRGNADIIAAASMCLTRIADNSAYAKEIMDSGSIIDILQALKANPSHAALVEQALSLLAKLGKASPEILEMLKKMGVVDIIVAALENFPDNKKILDLGALALKSLADTSDVTNALGHIQVSSGDASQAVSTTTANAMSKLAGLMLVAENIDTLLKNEGLGWLISTLSQVVGDPSETAAKILFNGCQALLRCMTNESQIYQIMQKGGVKLLIGIINAHAADEKVAHSALAALAKMLTRKENAVFLIKSGAIQAAQAILKANPDSEKTAKAVMEFYGRLANYPEAIAAMLAGGCVEDIVSILNKHASNPDIALQCIETLGKLGTSPENWARIAAAGGLEAVLKALNANKDNPEVVKACLKFLEAAAADPKTAELLKSMGGVAAILNAMGAHADNAELQALGTKLMDRLAGKDQLKEAVDTVMGIVRELANVDLSVHVGKLATALGVLTNLTLVDANLEALIRAGAVDALLQSFELASRLSPSDPNRNSLLLQAVAGLVRLAAKNPEIIQSIVAGGHLQKLLKTALSAPDNEALAEYVANIVASAAAVAINHPRMLADGTIEDIIALAKTFPLNEKILAYATRTLGFLGTNAELIQRMVNGGAAEVAVESVFANMEDIETLTNALGVLAQLAIDENSINALVRAGAVDALLEVLRVHPDNPTLCTIAMQNLCRLLISEEVAALIGEKGGIPMFIKAMRQHYTLEPLEEIAMILLDSLASLPENSKKLLEKELAAVELIQWVASAFPHNATLVEAAGRVLATLELADPAKATLVVSDESFILDADRCDVIIQDLKAGSLSPDDLKTMLSKLAMSLKDPAQAKTMLERGGLQALAQVIKQSKDNEPVFYAAASAFLALADYAGDGVVTHLEDALCVDALCDMMNAHEIFANPMDLNDLCLAVQTMARIKLSPAAVNEMLKNSPLKSLLKILVQSDDPELLAQAARLLGRLSNNEDAADQLKKIVNIRELVAAMRRNIQNEEFLKYATLLLGNLAQDETMAGVIGMEGGVAVICLVIETHPQNAGLIENCTFALANLSFGNDVNCSFIVACKGVTTLINAITTHSRSEELLENGICTLCNLCRCSDSNKDLIVKSGGAHAVVDAILNNFNSLDLLLTCFRTIGNLAYNGPSIVQVIKAGGVQGIVAGMTVHSDEKEVVEMAVRVLMNLSAELNDDYMGVLAQEGAVQAVVEVANQYREDPELSVLSFNCLCNLGRALENAKLIITQGCGRVVSRSLKAQNYAAEAAEAGMRLLSILSLCTPELDRLIDAKCTTAIVNSLNANKDDPRTISHGCVAIAHLAYSADAADKMANEGPIDTLLAILATSAEESGVQQSIYAALSSLCRSEPNAKHMSEPAMASLVETFKAYGGDVATMSIAYSFLSNLCVHPTAAAASYSANVLPPMMASLMRIVTADPVTVIRGLRALENMAFAGERLRDYMKGQGTETKVMGIHDSTSRDDVKRACKLVIDAINRNDGPALTALKPIHLEKKSARVLFGHDEPAKRVTLSEETKNFLTAGQLMLKHSNNAAPRMRHVYVTVDLKYIVWKDPKKPLDPKHKMRIFKIRSIETGRCTPQLSRKSLLGKWLAKEECAFAVMARERTIDVEAKDEATREKWVRSLQELLDWSKYQKAENTKFDSR